MTLTQKVSAILNTVKPGKKIESRRISALEAAGFIVQPNGVKFNFGTSGTVKEVDGKVIAQLSCSIGGKTKNGYHVNACYTFVIS